MKLLVIEDDPSLRKVIVTILSEEGYDVDETDHGKEALLLAETNIYDLLILDIMLPEKDGFSIIEKLRKNSNFTPILVITAKDAVSDRVKGLNLGADDYLVKPFELIELLARIKALLRRKGLQFDSRYLIYQSIQIDEIKHEVKGNNHLVSLSKKEYELLKYFVINPEQILTREQIFTRIWGLDAEGTDTIVDVYVHHLRKKLAPVHCDHLIKTLRNVGYIMKEE